MGGLILARKMNVTVASNDKGESTEIIDIGMVGEIIEINPLVINTLDENKFIPVIAPVGVGEQGETYNINADLVAGYTAEALGAEKLILLTDVEGVKNKKGEQLSTLKVNQAHKMINEGVVAAGMIPKVECCIHALEGGSGENPHHRRSGQACRFVGNFYPGRSRDGGCPQVRDEEPGYHSNHSPVCGRDLCPLSHRIGAGKRAQGLGCGRETVSGFCRRHRRQ